MGSTLTQLTYHIVFSTKNRENIIYSKMRDELYKYIVGIVKGEGAFFINIGGIENHIHIVLKLKATHILSSLVQKIKANSSKWINDGEKMRFKFCWQEGYGAFTVSESQLPKLIQYVKEQEKHHQKFSFKEELLIILKRHQIKYNEQYLWT